MPVNTSAPGSPTPGTPVIDVSDLHVTLGGAAILGGISLRVHAGEVVAILGANGSGKSTLIRSLVRAVPITSGDVALFGEPLGAHVPWDQIGYVPQRMGAQSGIAATAREIVASGLLGPRWLRLPRGWRAKATAALDRVGMAHRALTPMHELSGGQQQRVLIARALVRNPRLLFLDEPVAGVDRPSQLTFAQNLRELISHGVTVVVVLHELGDFAPLITRTIVLEHGTIRHDGGAVEPAAGHESPAHDHVHPHCDPPPPMTVSALPSPMFVEGI